MRIGLHRKAKRVTRNKLEKNLGGGFNKVKDMQYARRNGKYMTYTGPSKIHFGERAVFLVEQSSQFIQEARTWTELYRKIFNEV